MPDASMLLQQLRSALRRAKDSLSAAETYLQELEQSHPEIEAELAAQIEAKLDDSAEEGQVIYGVFDGEHMVDEHGKRYPVPANYASKSKLVQYDKLKLTIKENGAYVYKIIEEVPRKIVVGQLILDDAEYKVLVDGVAYKILYASVTFMRAKFATTVGDTISVLLPESEEPAQWCAYENVVPK